MIQEIIFILTFGITILNMLMTVGNLAGNGFYFPFYRQLDVRSWWIFYPAFFYQVFFWSKVFNLYIDLY